MIDVDRIITVGKELAEAAEAVATIPLGSIDFGAYKRLGAAVTRMEILIADLQQLQKQK